MIDSSVVKKAYHSIAEIMQQNRDYLLELDSKNGDGDLGISMSVGFGETSKALDLSEEKDLGRLFLFASKTFNEISPSSLGTILSFMMMGAAKYLKGKETVDLSEMAIALEKGLELIMQKAGSKIGEKTILDSLYPGIESLKNSAEKDTKERLIIAAKAASEGSESTKGMRAVHGRAAFYGDKSIGVLDAGSVVGKLIFEALENLG